MAMYKDKFGIDVAKRAARIRSRSLSQIVKELLANSLDAQATQITLTCAPAEGHRRNNAGMKAFEVKCEDNGHGCEEPEMLRRVGSSTSDLHAETRGRFGQGLIDVLVICERAEIRTLRHRLLFGDDGCKINVVRKPVNGMIVNGLLRHDGETDEELDAYFSSVILPPDVTFIFNGHNIGHRSPERVLPEIKLQTIVFDPKTERIRRFQRTTNVEIYPMYGDSPRIYELGIPVDDAPWELPFDINVLQKTPLDTDRDMLPAKYKASLIGQLIGPMSDYYINYMKERGDAPREIRDDASNAENLTSQAQGQLIKTITGADSQNIVRRNPLDKDDVSESQELESLGFVPLNRGTLPEGVRKLLQTNPTVANKHDQVCKPNFTCNPNFPSETERQRKCMSVLAKIASSLVGKRVRCERIQGPGYTATWSNATLQLNIDIDYLWDDPLGEKSLSVILHECAHDRVSGHAVAFADEVARLGAKLALLVSNTPDWWADLRRQLYVADTFSRESECPQAMSRVF